jgi:hypothetical protein
MRSTGGWPCRVAAVVDAAAGFLLFRFLEQASRRRAVLDTF